MVFISVTDKWRGILKVRMDSVIALYRTQKGTTCIATAAGKFYVTEPVQEVERLLIVAEAESRS
jgi:hypothetical protein